MMKKNIQCHTIRVLHLCIILFLGTITQMASAQNNTIVKGRVVDFETKEPIVGTSIVVEGTARGTVSDVNGNFAISAPDNGRLTISFIGYDSQTIEIASRTEIQVSLMPSSQQIEEVVAIGYGNVKKSELTSAISTISNKDLNKTMATSIDQALQGNAAGVLVITASAEPGGDVTMRIRGSSSIEGNNEPLIIIDGVPNDNSAMKTLPPSDVESIEVLKDASATAIFGSRGANGVVMITTKSGKQGKTRVSIDVKQTLNFPRKYLDLMDGPEFVQYDNLARTAWGDNRIGSLRPDTTASYDYQKMLIRSMAHRQDYNVSVTGGTKVLNYYFSSSLYKEDGLLNNSNSDRFSIRSKLKFQASETVSFDVNTSLSNTSIRKVGGGSGGAILQTAILRPNNKPVGKFEDGLYLDEETGEMISSNTQLANAMYKKDYTKGFSTNISGLLTWKIHKTLTFTSLGGYSYNDTQGHYYVPRFIYNDINSIVKQNKATRSTSLRKQWNNFNTLTYSRKIQKSNFSIMAAMELQSTINEGHEGTARLFNTDYYDWNNLQAASYFDAIASSSSKYNMASFFGRGMYNYDNRYMATATFRADGSSRFGKDNKFGYFPSASVAWIVKNEQFLKNANWLSNLKLRLSWGITGNDKIGQYRSMSLLSPDKVIFADTPYTTMGISSQMGNPNLQWETTNQFNAGFDAGLFYGRLNIALDGYYKKTTNLLYSYNLAQSSGRSTVMANIGRVDNKGVEIELTSRNLVGKFRWTTTLTMAYNKNKVVHLGGNDMISLYTLTDAVQKEVTYLKTGGPLGVFMGYKTSIYKDWDEVYADDAVWSENPAIMGTMPGMLRYQNTNGDNVIDDNDRVPLGQVEPKLTGGLTNTFSYKNFDMTVFIVGAYGNSIMNANVHRLYRFRAGATNAVNQIRSVLDAFRPVSTLFGDQGYRYGATPVPTVANNKNKALQEYTSNITDQWIEDGSFLRLKSVSLSYNLPSKFAKRLRLSNAGIILTGTNLLTLTKYTGYDPEMSSSQGTSNSRLGIDFSSYPAAMSVTIGINLTF